jgi:hypothetical protein
MEIANYHSYKKKEIVGLQTLKHSSKITNRVLSKELKA